MDILLSSHNKKLECLRADEWHSSRTSAMSQGLSVFVLCQPQHVGSQAGLTLLKMTGMLLLTDAWPSSRWQARTETVRNTHRHGSLQWQLWKKWGNLYRKLPEQTFPPHPWQKQGYMPTSKLRTGLENGLPISFYPWVGNWMEFSGDTATWKSVYTWKKNQILLARKKLGVGEVWGSIWCVQPTVSDQITHDSDVYWISSHPSLTYFISPGKRAVRG